MNKLAIKRKSEIESMLLYSDELVKDISSLHNQLLSDGGQMLKFQVLIKFFLELMSSCLDYLAVDIHSVYNENTPIHKVCFPVPCYKENEEMIGSETRLTKTIENKIGVNASKDLNLVHRLRKHQHFYHQNHNIWLSDFKKLRNGNSHRNLSIYEEKIDNNRIVDVPEGGRIVFKGERSGIYDMGIGKEFKTKEDLQNSFSSPVSVEITKHYIFPEAHWINCNVVEFIKLVRKNVENIINDVYSFLDSK